MPQNQIVFIVGPTAVGKSDIAFQVAERVEGEVVSCDAMQVYKEISIASSKPSPQERQVIPHHLLDIISVQDEFSVGCYNELACAAIRRIHGNQTIPLVVGGSGLYMQVLLDGLFEVGKDEEIRADIADRIEKEGLEVIYAELQTVDPQAAEKINARDARRIARALEVYRITGEPISSLQKQREGLWGKYDIKVFAINRPREELYARINTRVEDMLTAGLVDEISAIRDLPLSLTARGLIGVKEIMGYLNGQADLNQAKEDLKQNTRRLAKRQMTWFRQEKRIEWLDIENSNEPQIVNKIIEEISGVKK